MKYKQMKDTPKLCSGTLRTMTKKAWLRIAKLVQIPEINLISTKLKSTCKPVLLSLIQIF